MAARPASARRSRSGARQAGRDRAALRPRWLSRPSPRALARSARRLPAAARTAAGGARGPAGAAGPLVRRPHASSRAAAPWWWSAAALPDAVAGGGGTPGRGLLRYGDDRPVDRRRHGDLHGRRGADARRRARRAPVPAARLPVRATAAARAGRRPGTAERLVSYNGRTFDLPMLAARLTFHGLFREQATIPDAHDDLLPTARRLFRRPLGGARLADIEAGVSACGGRSTARAARCRPATSATSAAARRTSWRCRPQLPGRRQPRPVGGRAGAPARRRLARRAGARPARHGARPAAGGRRRRRPGAGRVGPGDRRRSGGGERAAARCSRLLLATGEIERAEELWRIGTRRASVDAATAWIEVARIRERHRGDLAGRWRRPPPRRACSIWPWRSVAVAAWMPSAVPRPAGREVASGGRGAGWLPPIVEPPARRAWPDQFGYPLRRFCSTSATWSIAARAAAAGSAPPGSARPSSMKAASMSPAPMVETSSTRCPSGRCQDPIHHRARGRGSRRSPPAGAVAQPRPQRLQLRQRGRTVGAHVLAAADDQVHRPQPGQQRGIHLCEGLRADRLALVGAAQPAPAGLQPAWDRRPRRGPTRGSRPPPARTGRPARSYRPWTPRPPCCTSTSSRPAAVSV